VIMRTLAAACLLMATTATAQQADTLIYAEGRIMNKTTKELIPAKISYQSLPYGNIVGQLNGSTYRFPFFTEERYEIVVEAAGFAPAKYMLDPGQANGERKVVQDVELNPPVSASVAAETAHTVGKLMNLDNLIFAQAQAKIEPSSYDELDKIVTMLETYPKMVIQLEGHTDNRGTPKLNAKLSQDRADAVRKALVTRGLEEGRLTAKGYGQDVPIADNKTDDGRQKNRRVQFKITDKVPKQPKAQP